MSNEITEKDRFNYEEYQRNVHDDGFAPLLIEEWMVDTERWPEPEPEVKLHPAVQALLKQFEFYPVSDEAKERVQSVRDHYRELAEWTAHSTPGGAEQTTAIRKLREAKDCAVLAIILDEV